MPHYTNDIPDEIEDDDYDIEMQRMYYVWKKLRLKNFPEKDCDRDKFDKLVDNLLDSLKQLISEEPTHEPKFTSMSNMTILAYWEDEWCFELNVTNHQRMKV